MTFAMPVDCPSEEIVRGYLDGRLAGELITSVNRHVDSCRSCREAIRGTPRGPVSLDETQPAASEGLGLLATAADSTPVPRIELLAGGVPRGGTIGRYMILDVLGQGGMGVVYAAFDPQLDRKVAVKVLRPEAAGEAAAARLLREGRAIARLAHPNVVAVFDVGTHDGSVFVAMELVDGAGLDRWLETPRPWREVVEAFEQAGAGLIAAHEAGMIHRDFKPANVLRGKDGRVRVTDFGLARLDEDERPSGPRLQTNEDTGIVALTQTGAIMGTPAYMSVEQFEGAVVDAKTDQFSFAVALYEGLYGERPFAGKTTVEILERLLANDVSPAPATANVPPWLRAVVLRGLRASTTERYDSVADMLAAMRADPAARRRKIWIAGGGGAGVLALATVGAFALRGAGGPPCEGVGGEVDAVWNSSKQAELVHAFGSSKAPYARDALAAVTRSLGTYATSWRAMKVDACRATHVRHEQTEEHQGLRTVCLDERLVELRAMVSVFGGADEDMIKNAAHATATLVPLAICADLPALTQRVRPPADPATRAAVDAVRARLATTRALGATGRYQAASTAAKQLATEAEALHYKPILGDALLVAGYYAERAGDPKAAEPLLTRAVQSAAAGRDDRTEADAWIDLVHAVGIGLERYDDALTDVGHAEAAIERIGGDPEKQATLDEYRGLVLGNQGKYEDARAAIAKALDARRRLFPAGDLEIAASLTDLGNQLDDLGKYEAARTAHAEALAIREKTLGLVHPDVAGVLQNLATAQLGLGDLKAGEASLRRSLAIREATLGPDHPDVASTLSNLGVTLRMEARFDEAIDVYLRALGIVERRLGKVHAAVAPVLLNLGATYMLQRKWSESEAALQRGLAIIVKVKGEDHPDAAAFWGTLSQVYQGQSRWPEAYSANARAIAIDTKAVGPDHPKLEQDYSELGELYFTQGRLDEALATFRKVLASHEKTLGKDNPALAVELSNIGSLLGQLKRHGEAHEVYERALALDEKALGPKSGELIFDLNGLGQMDLQLGKRDEAIAMFERVFLLDNAAAHAQGLANVKFYLASALWDAGRDRTRARKLMEQARAENKQMGEDAGVVAAEAWLRVHR